ncbi:hypothetical protein [Pelagovum pacificum]|uniref:DUF995 domain-containing protein n=1 Tax=Pelagovum pacificum TaxID=2588711 RepID=A0A5C5GGJ9_9RHOB|nr:hypothetical protein [Pelagovum pacificum]QQA43703.1 hypothetical protein I8N54_03760 [Pelagovum pacificum]TNY33167.1 hypothetical protein FHY64_07775 [Pelagovum pacificum]
MRHALLIALLLAPATLAAQDMLGPDEFAEITDGNTYTFLLDGEPYGIERYMADQKVIWSFLDGECSLGTWYPEGEAICFRYDHDPENPQCWEIYETDVGLRTVFLEEPARSLDYEARQGDEELVCENFGS